MRDPNFRSARAHVAAIVNSTACQGLAARRQHRSAWAVACACALAACTGAIDAEERGGAPGPDQGPGAAGFGATGAGGSGAVPGTGSPDEQPAPSTRAARLTHVQWENSVRDLFRLGTDQSFASLLRSDPVQSGFVFDNNSLTLEVDEALWSGYQRAAADIAAFVTSDAGRLAAFAPPAGSDANARARAFVTELGLRGHRRPLDDQEVSEYLALFAMGPALYDGLPAFEAGARVVIEALLQSPFFLYRIETGAEPAGAVIALDDYEAAARLSYALWNSMPDDALFAAAAAHTLGDSAEVERQARRMLAEPRAQAVIESFHAQLFQADRFDDIRPSPAFFPDAPDMLGEHAVTEQAMFVRDLVFEQHGSYADLLTSTDTFVNADLARVYGLSGAFGSSFVKTALDRAQRRGILTHIGFLASNATSVNPDPIHRGVFVARRIACMQIAAPPANVPPLPEPQGRTNRETVEEHTQQPGTVCASCHEHLINPLGFPFESFDAIGQFRSEDNGQPVDTATEARIGGSSVAVAGALELASALAASEDAHACYARHWLEFVLGRPDAPEDTALIGRLARASLEQELAIDELIVALVTSRSFLTRSSEELP